MGITELSSLPPAMRQYVEIKAGYEDCILLFRMGDFYEIFFEDAVTAARILDITLTSRGKSREDSIPMCGFPYHAASPYITKLIEKGFKAKRWIVELGHSWYNRFRKIHVRYEKEDVSFLGLVQLASAIIVFNRICSVYPV